MKKKVLFYVLSFIIELSLFAVVIIYFNKFLIIPLICLVLLLLFTIYAFIGEIFVGKKYIIIKNDNILVLRKKTIILTIEKEKIERLVVIYDVMYDSIDFISFKYKNKKYFFEISKETENDVKLFLSNLEYKRKTSIILRLFLLILDFFTYL